MIDDRKVVVVMPAYNAELTLIQTYNEVIAQSIVDQVVVVDDASSDDTAKLAAELPSVVLSVHPSNKGYGGNQKTCYRLALEADADIVIMVHPDYQYTPKLIPAMAGMISSGLFECVIGSRVLGGKAMQQGMPLWKYASNRVLTMLQNLLMGAKLSEYHTGYRAFSGQLLRRLALDRNSDDFVFDAQMLAQILWQDVTIGEVSCPAKYFPEASSINFSRSLKYGLGCLAVALRFRLARWGIVSPGFLTHD